MSPRPHSSSTPGLPPLTVVSVGACRIVIIDELITGKISVWCRSHRHGYCQYPPVDTECPARGTGMKG